MGLTESQLSRWTQPSSDNEEAMCDRSARMIKAALDRFPGLAGRSYIVIPQGSYHNNTNVRLSSDVDICVAFTDVMINDFTYAPGWSWQMLGYSSSDKVFSDDRELIGNALRDHFGIAAIKPGGKAFEVLANPGTRVGADVVPAWRFNGWHSHGQPGTPEKREGVVFWTREGKKVINFPEQHYAVGKSKNMRTGRAFKRAARILKRIRYDMLDSNVPVADGVSSFTLESAMYNVPNDRFDQNTWLKVMRDSLYYIDNAIYTGEAERDWVEVSQMKWMFKKNYDVPSNWSASNLRAFIQAAREAVG